ncbi:MAG: hypothetical protein ABIP82_06165 [Nitrospirales bacterium]
MNRIMMRVMVVGFILIVFGGCRTAPLFNVNEATITPVSGKEPILEDVTKAIVSASTGSTPPWNMQVVKPGHIVATLHVRGHMAAVDILYTTNSYSIKHKESSNLKYDAADGTIHSNYNAWIQRLDGNIRGKLSLL